SSNRKNYDRRRGQNYAAHLHFVQTLAQYNECQHHSEQGKEPGDRSDNRSVLLTQSREISQSSQPGEKAAQHTVCSTTTIAIQLAPHLQEHAKSHRQHTEGE